LASGVRSSSRINGATRSIPSIGPPVLKKTMVVVAQDGRARNTRRSKAKMAHDAHGELKAIPEDHPQQRGSGNLPDLHNDGKDTRTVASFHTSLNGAALSVNGKGPDDGGGTHGCGTPGMYDEDALGEEDAEGEEDPNPESIAEE